MALIAKDYFNDGIKAIPNLSAIHINEMVDDLIVSCEDDYLVGALGYPLAKAFIDGLAVLPAPEQRWLDLLNGVEFTSNGYVYKWGGFVDATTFKSPIANYVMVKYLESMSVLTGGVGELRTKTENSNQEPDLPKILANNKVMVKANAMLLLYLDANKELYPEFDNNVNADFYIFANPF